MDGVATSTVQNGFSLFRVCHDLLGAPVSVTGHGGLWESTHRNMAHSHSKGLSSPLRYLSYLTTHTNRVQVIFRAPAV